MTSAASSSIDPLKILLLGDSGTGKDCLVRRLTHKTFSNTYCPSQECDIVSIRFQIDQDTDIPIQIFNIPGFRREKTKMNEYFQTIDGCIMMFDVTRAPTYDNILNWNEDLRSINKSDDLPCMLLANKCDLEKDQELNRIMNNIENYCQIVGFCCYFEVSTRDNINLERSIQTLIREIIKRKGLPTISLPSPSILTSPMTSTYVEDRKQEFILKVLVIGEANTGKTALIRRYVNNTFSGQYRTTIGADLALRKIQYNNDITIHLHIWDIAGQERFGGMTHVFYKDAAGCLIVFDVSTPLILTSGAVKWKDDFDKKVNVDSDHRVPCILVGNKCDLKREGIVANEDSMKEFCRVHQFDQWLVTSAKENTDVPKAFLLLIDEMMKHKNTGRILRRQTSDIIRPSPLAAPRIKPTKCCYS